MKNKIILIAGDPNSINSEIIFKSFKKLNKLQKNKIYLIGSYELILKQLKHLNFSIKLRTVTNLKEVIIGDFLKIINIDLNFKNPFNVEKKEAAKYVLKSLNLAHKIALENKIAELKKGNRGSINLELAGVKKTIDLKQGMTSDDIKKELNNFIKEVFNALNERRFGTSYYPRNETNNSSAEGDDIFEQPN